MQFGTMASSDTPLTGNAAARALTGLNPESPLITSDRFRSIRTMRGGPDASTSGIAGAHVLDDWRDAFNPQSPAMWILLFLLAAVGMMQVRVAVGGKRGFKGGLG